MSRIKEAYSVKSVGLFEVKDWLLKKHYAKRMCHIMYSFGLFSKSNILCGVVTFGKPAGSSLCVSICGDTYSKYVIELNRLVVSDGLGRNVLSYFVSKSIRMLPDDKIIVSFADRNMGHNGYIYQATNFIYTGETENTTQLVDKDGNEFHFRNIGHYQQNNKLNVELVKRRSNESGINRIEIAEYLRANKGSWTATAIDKELGYKHTAAHWFRLDGGFSFPSVDDWFRLKDLLGFDETYDTVMGDYTLVPCPKAIIKKLELKTIKILPKHRYIFFKGSKSFVISCRASLRLKAKPYPKGDNNRYESTYKPTVQTKLF